MVFTASLHGVSAKSEKIPDLPIVAVAQNEVAVEVLPANAPAPKPKTQLVKEIGSAGTITELACSAGDLKAAQSASKSHGS